MDSIPKNGPHCPDEINVSKARLGVCCHGCGHCTPTEQYSVLLVPMLVVCHCSSRMAGAITVTSWRWLTGSRCASVQAHSRAYSRTCPPIRCSWRPGQALSAVVLSAMRSAVYATASVCTHLLLSRCSPWLPVAQRNRRPGLPSCIIFVMRKLTSPAACVVATDVPGRDLSSSSA